MRSKPPSLERRTTSNSKSAASSPAEEAEDPIQRLSTVAFVPFELGTATGVSNEVRRAVRVQAAKASAAARKRTIARKLALKQYATSEETLLSPKGEGEPSRRASATSGIVPEFHSIKLESHQLPTRSMSTGHLDHLRPYPVPHWHPQIPALVDHFLRYFAPEATTGHYGREALRTQLWPEALNDASLFQAILLVVASHASVTGALAVPPQLLAQLKHSTIESINDAVARSEEKGGIQEPAIGAIALLGGWELEYGDAAIHDTHMRGLDTIVALRGGLFGACSPHPGFTSLTPITVNLILAAGYDLPLYAGRIPSSLDGISQAPYSDQGTHPRMLPPGFQYLTAKHLIIPSLIDTICELDKFPTSNIATISSLAETEQRLIEWDLETITRARYSPFQTETEDNMKRQATTQIRLAGLAVCKYLRMMTMTGSSAAHASLQDLYSEALQVNLWLLIGTAYEEVTFWALCAICSITGRCEPVHMRALKWLQLQLDVADWTSYKEVLGRYVYHESVMDGRVYALWEAVNSSTISNDWPANVTEPTRFAKGVEHPATGLVLR